MHNFLSQAPPQTSLKQKPEPQIIEKTRSKLTNPKYDRNYTKQEISLVFSYLNANSYFQNLKKQHKYVHWMSTEQKRKLLIESYAFLAKSNIACQIQSIQQQTAINHNLQKIKIVVIVLYGKLHFNGKAYSAGQWAEVHSPLEKLVEEKCVCLMFQQNIFQIRLIQLNFFHFKKALLKKYFFQKIGIHLLSKKIDQIVHSVHFHSSSQKITIDHNKPEYQNPGIYILIKGDFFIFDLQNKLCLGQIKESYVGQESLWSYFEYNLRSKQNIWQFLFCPKQLLIHSLSEQKYQQIKTRLFEIYDKKKLHRNKRQQALSNLYKQLTDTKEKAQKRVKSKIQIEKCQQTLQKVRKLKPKWMVEEEKKYKKTKNRRRNIFSQSSQNQKSKKKYFSIKSAKTLEKKELKEKSPQQKQLFTRHFSSMKTDIDSTVAATPLHLTRSHRFMNQTKDDKGFSKLSRTSFYHQGNKTGRSYFTTPQKVKSEPKLPKSQAQSQSHELDKWDVDYSKKYDRCLSWSVRKEKNLVKVVKFKQKLFPKERAQFFTIEDATEALEKSFYDLQRLRRLDDEEKNKRAFQKVFKQKMLLMDSSRKNPLILR